MWFVLLSLVTTAQAGKKNKKNDEPPAEAEAEAEAAPDEAADEAAEGNPEIPPFDPTNGGGAPLPPMTWTPPKGDFAFGTAVDITLTKQGKPRTLHLDATWKMVDGDDGLSLTMDEVVLGEGSDTSVLPAAWFVLAQPQLAVSEDAETVRAYLPVDDLMARLENAMAVPGSMPLAKAKLGISVAEAMKQGNVHQAASGQAELWAPLVLAGLATSEIATPLRISGWLTGTGATEVIPVGEASCGESQCVIIELRYTEGTGADVESVSTRYRIEPEGLKVHGAQRRTNVYRDDGGERVMLSILEKYLPET